MTSKKLLAVLATGDLLLFLVELFEGVTEALVVDGKFETVNAFAPRILVSRPRLVVMGNNTNLEQVLES